MTAMSPNGTTAPTLPARAAHRTPRTALLLASGLYALGVHGLLGGLPFLGDLGLLLGVLVLALGVVVAGLAQWRRHGRLLVPAVVGGPRSLLGAWVAGGPVLFFTVLPESTPVRVTVMISLLLGTVFVAALQLEDAELTAKPAA